MDIVNFFPCRWTFMYQCFGFEVVQEDDRGNTFLLNVDTYMSGVEKKSLAPGRPGD